MIVELLVHTQGVSMAYIRVRRTCEVGESCPSLSFDTETARHDLLRIETLPS
jgi:hypothetical protein